ncbi:ERMIN protein, partial [Atlantisia rogersi]|nr:ERMIN protein [Atlantisia rogersi]
MTEEVPAAPEMLECNGSIPPEKGPLQVMGSIDEIAKSLGTVPYANAETSPDQNQEGSRNSLAEDSVRGDCDREKLCAGKVQGCSCPQPHSLGVAAGPGSGGTTGPSVEAVETLEGSTHGRGNAAQEPEEDVGDDDDDEEEEDTEEDEVQVIEIKKENSEVSHLEQHGGSKEPSPPTSPGCDSQAEKPGEQHSLGKKNDISRHSYSRYNTISYRRIRKGNTKQRIDEFESMMHL